MIQPREAAACEKEAATSLDMAAQTNRDTAQVAIFPYYGRNM